MFKLIFPINPDKLRVCVQLHDYHNEADVLKFWSLITEIPLHQFNKSYQKKSLHKFSKKGYMGCIKITYGDSHIARVLLSFAKSFIKLYI